MTERWYALRSKPRKEALLWEQLLIREMETFYPRVRVQTVNPRARKARPYFPGYVFVRADLGRVNLSSLQWMPGALGLVSFGGHPAPAWVPDELIAGGIRRRVDEVNQAGGELLDGLQPGETVAIQEGLFSGYGSHLRCQTAGERTRTGVVEAAWSKAGYDGCIRDLRNRHCFVYVGMAECA